jgi:hypothetical protein
MFRRLRNGKAAHLCAAFRVLIISTCGIASQPISPVSLAVRRAWCRIALPQLNISVTKSTLWAAISGILADAEHPRLQSSAAQLAALRPVTPAALTGCNRVARDLVA